MKVEVERLRFQNEQLLNRILNPIKPVEDKPIEVKPELLTPKHIPWRVQQQALEKREREIAEQIRKQRLTEVQSVTTENIQGKSIEQLEQELGVVQEN